MTQSRGSSPSAYSPIFNPNDGNAKVTSANVRFQAIASSVANSGVVYALTHTLGKIPAAVMFSPRGTVGQLKASSTSANSVGAATVSAHTSAKVYYAGAKNSAFTAYLFL